MFFNFFKIMINIRLFIRKITCLKIFIRMKLFECAKDHIKKSLVSDTLFLHNMQKSKAMIVMPSKISRLSHRYQTFLDRYLWITLKTCQYHVNCKQWMKMMCQWKGMIDKTNWKKSYHDITELRGWSSASHGNVSEIVSHTTSQQWIVLWHESVSEQSAQHSVNVTVHTWTHWE